MKKFYLPLLALLAIALIFLFYPKNTIQNLPTSPKLSGSADENLKQTLIVTFKNYRESLYKIKQFELVKASDKQSTSELKTDVCLKMAYDLNAFIMRARLRPRSIEKKECQKLSKIYQDISLLKQTKNVLPSYQKRLNQDLAYFTDELNKQEWKSEELTKKIKDFQKETVQNRIKLKKISRANKNSLTPSPKCMKTIELHKKEFFITCKS